MASSKRVVAARRGSLNLAGLAAVALFAVTVKTGLSFVSTPAAATRACRGLANSRQSSRVIVASKTREECKAEEENPLTKIKELGIAGTISYALWESAFWIIGGGGAFAAYVWANGHLPDFSNQEEMAQVGGGAFVFINGARLVVPLRIGLAISTTPWIDDNIVKKFITKDDECEIYDDDVEEAGKKEAAKVSKEKVSA